MSTFYYSQFGGGKAPLQPNTGPAPAQMGAQGNKPAQPVSGPMPAQPNG